MGKNENNFQSKWPQLCRRPEGPLSHPQELEQGGLYFMVLAAQRAPKTPPGELEVGGPSTFQFLNTKIHLANLAKKQFYYYYYYWTLP